MKTYKFVALSLILGPFIISCIGQRDSVLTIKGRTMGTTYIVKYVAQVDIPTNLVLKEKVDEVLVNINQSMSTYINDSEISLFNQNYSTTWFNVSKQFIKVLAHAQKISKITKGAFDVTVGPLVNLWGFGPLGSRKIPNKQQIKNKLKTIGFQKLIINHKKSQVRKRDARIYIDFSAIAKGFGVDQVSQLLEDEGIDNYLVEIGGEIKAKGSKPRGVNWKIAVESPRPDDKTYSKILNIGGLALATSGNYRNYFDEYGKRYSHTIDPKTGSPVEHTLASVTVIDSNSCMNADAWATAFMVLGHKKGMEVAKKVAIAAYFIYEENGAFVKVATPKFLEQFKL
ncbi:MAG: FAD:protein FMN transferase [Bacteriovoracaceae bacterium]|nr:FAD:protein FMN transferase [Bacteriovoracaceae bacterium]